MTLGRLHRTRESATPHPPPPSPPFTAFEQARGALGAGGGQSGSRGAASSESAARVRCGVWAPGLAWRAGVARTRVRVRAEVAGAVDESVLRHDSRDTSGGGDTRDPPTASRDSFP